MQINYLCIKIFFYDKWLIIIKSKWILSGISCRIFITVCLLFPDKIIFISCRFLSVKIISMHSYLLFSINNNLFFCEENLKIEESEFNRARDEKGINSLEGWKIIAMYKVFSCYANILLMPGTSPIWAAGMASMCSLRKVQIYFSIKKIIL